METTVDSLLSSRVLLLIGAALYAVSLVGMVWAYFDANSRGKSGCSVAILVWLTGPLGLLMWLLSRPDSPTTYPSLRSHETEDDRAD